MSVSTKPDSTRCLKSANYLSCELSTYDGDASTGTYSSLFYVLLFSSLCLLVEKLLLLVFLAAVVVVVTAMSCKRATCYATV